MPCARPGIPQVSQGLLSLWWDALFSWVSLRSPHLTALSLAGIDVAHLCRNSGLCVDSGNTHFCRCQAGYTGSYCEEQVDECSPNPCQNGATCTDYLGGYSCEVGAALLCWALSGGCSNSGGSGIDQVFVCSVHRAAAG